MVTIPILARAFNILLEALQLYLGIYSLHNLRRGGAIAAYWGGSDQLDIKRHGLWVFNTFWLYVTAPSVAASPDVATLTVAMD